MDGNKRMKARTRQFSFRSAPWFKNRLEGVAIVSLSRLETWSRDQAPVVKILKTTDGGNLWLDTGNSLPNEYCSRLIPEVTDRILLSCSGATGDFYESVDEGATWKQVREHQNF